MTVSTKQSALLGLRMYNSPRSRIALSREAEGLVIWITMMKLKRTNVSIVVADFAFATTFFYELELDCSPMISDSFTLTCTTTPTTFFASKVLSHSMLFAVLFHQVLHCDVRQFLAHGGGVEPPSYLGNSQAHSPRLLAVNVACREIIPALLQSREG